MGAQLQTVMHRGTGFGGARRGHSSIKYPMSFVGERRRVSRISTRPISIKVFKSLGLTGVSFVRLAALRQHSLTDRGNLEYGLGIGHSKSVLNRTLRRSGSLGAKQWRKVVLNCPLAQLD